MPDLPCQHIYARLFIEVRVDYISSVGRRFIPTAPIRRFWLSAKEPIISMHCADRGGLSSYWSRCPGADPAARPPRLAGCIRTLAGGARLAAGEGSGAV